MIVDDNIDYDLHIHSEISDGEYTIEKLFDLAKEHNLKGLSITDHDTTLGVDLSLELGKISNINSVSGIEISAFDFYTQKKVHILGYHVPPNNMELKEFCSNVNAQRTEASYLAWKEIKKEGYKIKWQNVTKEAATSAAIYKQHIFKAMVNCGYWDKSDIVTYDKYFSEGKNGKNIGKAFFPIQYCDDRDAVYLLKCLDAIPVLAHPGLYDNWDLIPELIECGLQGIETYHPSHSLIDIQKCEYYCKYYHLLKTGGSDFHDLHGNPDKKFGKYGISKKEMNDFGKKNIECAMR